MSGPCATNFADLSAATSDIWSIDGVHQTVA
jgi:hypothetical protein